MLELSIIIPYHNEGKEFILKTIESIRDTIDINKYEIIIIDDCSDEPLIINGVKIKRHSENLGVGAAFDTGVKIARSKNLFLMGCDVRFIKNGWASKMLSEIKNNPKSLICTSVVSLWSHEPLITFEDSRKLYKYNGATLLLTHSNKQSPDMPDEFRNILNAQWMPREYISLIRPDIKPENDEFAKYLKEKYNVSLNRNGCYEIPCILGAAYGTTKKWYNYIDGFWGHKKWGTLEPYISLKCHLFGGKCLTASHIETAHIFKNTGTHGTDFKYIAYNKLLVAWLLFSIPDKNRLINYLADSDYLREAKIMIEDNFRAIIKKRNKYQKKIVFPIKALVEKFKLNFYEDKKGDM